MTEGNQVEFCEKELNKEFKAHRVLLTTSCAKALEVAALLVGVDRLSEVVLPSFTHPATANAFALRGARLVFADIDGETFNIDSGSIEEKLSSRTKCIVPVHYGGVACDMDAIVEMAGGLGVDVIEDAAHALGSSYRGRPLGTIGRIGTISFHDTKNVSCVKGGALVINDPSLVEVAERVVDHGTDRLMFTRGHLDRYVWRCVGTDAILAEPLAALLAARIKLKESILHRRRLLWRRYREELSEWARQSDVRLPSTTSCNESNAHIFPVVFPVSETAARFLASMKRMGVRATSHFEPLHLSPVGVSMGYQRGDLPVTERVASTLVRLPLDNEIEDGKQEAIISAVVSFR